MGSLAPGEVTRLLRTWRDGDQDALHQIVPMLYKELRQAAHRARSGRLGEQTLVTTALVNEVFLRLTRTEGLTLHDRAHFLALCAQVMRRILIDSARERASSKHGGDAWRIPFDDDAFVVLKPADLVRLDDALTHLAEVDARKSKVVELRFFGGLSVEETARVLGVSRETTLRDWRFARAWLKNEINGPANYA